MANPAKVSLKHGGAWKEPTKLYVKHSGAWKEPVGAWVKSGGTWQQFWPTTDPTKTLDLDFTITTTLDPRITFSRASIATYFNSAGVLTTAASGAARFDHDPVTHAPKGLLIEEQRVNSMTWSQDLTNANWIKTGLTVTANDTTAPDGTATADRITASATTATINGQTNAATNYIASIFIKKGTSDWIYMVGQVTDAPKAWFNINTGTVGTVQAGFVATGIQNIGNGWYRCWIADAFGTGNEPVMVGLCDADNSSTVTVGRTAYLWGAQQETTGAFPTSYIPVPGSSAITRAVDVATMTGANFSSWYNQSAGTLVVEFDVLGITSLQRIIQADNNATSQTIKLWLSSGNPSASITNVSLQADFFGFGGGVVPVNTTRKFGMSYALNDVAACFNGGSVQTDATATMATPTQLRIGGDGVASDCLKGHIRRVQFFNTNKSDAELQALTAP